MSEPNDVPSFSLFLERFGVDKFVHKQIQHYTNYFTPEIPNTVAKDDVDRSPKEDDSDDIYYEDYDQFSVDGVYPDPTNADNQSSNLDLTIVKTASDLWPLTRPLSRQWHITIHEYFRTNTQFKDDAHQFFSANASRRVTNAMNSPISAYFSLLLRDIYAQLFHPTEYNNSTLRLDYPPLPAQDKLISPDQFVAYIQSTLTGYHITPLLDAIKQYYMYTVASWMLNRHKNQQLLVTHNDAHETLNANQIMNAASESDADLVLYPHQIHHQTLITMDEPQSLTVQQDGDDTPIVPSNSTTTSSNHVALLQHSLTHSDSSQSLIIPTSIPSTRSQPHDQQGNELVPGHSQRTKPTKSNRVDVYLPDCEIIRYKKHSYPYARENLDRRLVSHDANAHKEPLIPPNTLQNDSNETLSGINTNVDLQQQAKPPIESETSHAPATESDCFIVNAYNSRFFTPLRLLTPSYTPSHSIDKQQSSSLALQSTARGDDAAHTPNDTQMADDTTHSLTAQPSEAPSTSNTTNTTNTQSKNPQTAPQRSFFHTVLATTHQYVDDMLTGNFTGFQNILPKYHTSSSSSQDRRHTVVTIRPDRRVELLEQSLDDDDDDQDLGRDGAHHRQYQRHRPLSALSSSTLSIGSCTDAVESEDLQQHRNGHPTHQFQHQYPFIQGPPPQHSSIQDDDHDGDDDDEAEMQVIHDIANLSLNRKRPHCQRKDKASCSTSHLISRQVTHSNVRNSENNDSEDPNTMEMSCAAITSPLDDNTLNNDDDDDISSVSSGWSYSDYSDLSDDDSDSDVDGDSNNHDLSTSQLTASSMASPHRAAPRVAPTSSHIPLGSSRRKFRRSLNPHDQPQDGQIDDDNAYVMLPAITANPPITSHHHKGRLMLSGPDTPGLHQAQRPLRVMNHQFVAITRTLVPPGSQRRPPNDDTVAVDSSSNGTSSAHTALQPHTTENIIQPQDAADNKFNLCKVHSLFQSKIEKRWPALSNFQHIFRWALCGTQQPSQQHDGIITTPDEHGDDIPLYHHHEENNPPHQGLDAAATANVQISSSSSSSTSVAPSAPQHSSSSKSNDWFKTCEDVFLQNSLLKSLNISPLCAVEHFYTTCLQTFTSVIANEITATFTLDIFTLVRDQLCPRCNCRIFHPSLFSTPLDKSSEDGGGMDDDEKPTSSSNTTSTAAWTGQQRSSAAPGSDDASLLAALLNNAALATPADGEHGLESDQMDTTLDTDHSSRRTTTQSRKPVDPELYELLKVRTSIACAGCRFVYELSTDPNTTIRLESESSFDDGVSPNPVVQGIPPSKPHTDVAEECPCSFTALSHEICTVYDRISSYLFPTPEQQQQQQQQPLVEKQQQQSSSRPQSSSDAYQTTPHTPLHHHHHHHHHRHHEAHPISEVAFEHSRHQETPLNNNNNSHQLLHSGKSSSYLYSPHHASAESDYTLGLDELNLLKAIPPPVPSSSAGGGVAGGGDSTNYELTMDSQQQRLLEGILYQIRRQKVSQSSSRQSTYPQFVGHAPLSTTAPSSSHMLYHDYNSSYAASMDGDTPAISTPAMSSVFGYHDHTHRSHHHVHHDPHGNDEDLDNHAYISSNPPPQRRLDDDYDAFLHELDHSSDAMRETTDRHRHSSRYQNNYSSHRMQQIGGGASSSTSKLHTCEFSTSFPSSSGHYATMKSFPSTSPSLLSSSNFAPNFATSMASSTTFNSSTTPQLHSTNGSGFSIGADSGKSDMLKAGHAIGMSSHAAVQHQHPPFAIDSMEINTGQSLYHPAGVNHPLNHPHISHTRRGPQPTHRLAQLFLERSYSQHSPSSSPRGAHTSYFNAQHDLTYRSNAHLEATDQDVHSHHHHNHNQQLSELNKGPAPPHIHPHPHPHQHRQPQFLPPSSLSSQHDAQKCLSMSRDFVASVKKQLGAHYDNRLDPLLADFYETGVSTIKVLQRGGGTTATAAVAGDVPGGAGRNVYGGGMGVGHDVYPESHSSFHVDHRMMSSALPVDYSSLDISQGVQNTPRMSDSRPSTSDGEELRKPTARYTSAAR